MLVSANGFVRGRFITEGRRPVVVQEFSRDRLVREITAERASVDWARGFTLAEPTVDLVLDNCQVVDMRAQGDVNQRDGLTVPELSLLGLQGDDPSKLHYQELMARAEQVRGGTRARVARLEYMVGSLEREISSRLQRRYALSVTAMLLLLLGATLAIWLRHSLPLVIYIWAFVPSIGNVLLIAGGDHMIRSGLAIPGMMVLWSGNALLLTMLVLVYRRLMRN